MAPKSNDTPSSIRIRENQRRSRMRRKELIDHLQAEVKRYELEGVKATQQMQQAARKVAHENIRLRSLLAAYGVSQDEVDSYLRSTGHPGVELHPNAHLQTFKANHTKITTGRARSHTLHDADSQVPAPWPRRTRQQPTVARERCPEEDSSGSGTTPEVQETSNNCPVEEISECPNTATCFCPPMSAPRLAPHGSSSEISCETAATIIIELNREDDRDAVRASLGCTGAGDCKVKSSVVMELMDEE
ncbi:hypothetical protein M011DRAFT_2260 [Sporormia fimetaria CBS 119925]|uniref:BZIP domain-containing protein n=1 Tax=Sporormia fimetaria CBS 119925 TaxID=1340428 RepID=A0A6A6VNF8_9PLEO|nr:hypothetical protein M011DRAFT_2260 [Sporormia fimetaria CBS 119925]